MASIDIRVVLVRSIYPRNVGATARAMSNMGVDQLILIGPHCEINYDSNQAAANGQKPLEQRISYSSWEEFYKNEPESIRIALTARDGRGRAVQDLSTTLEWLKKEHPLLQSSNDDDNTTPIVHLIFGPEDWGLSADDIKYTHYCCSIPTFSENPSLNLAQAALLALFILRQNFGGSKSKLDGQQPQREMPVLDYDVDKTLQTWLMALGFDISAKRINAHSVFRRMLFHNVPTKKELLMLETVLQQNIRKLREYNTLIGRPELRKQKK